MILQSACLRALLEMKSGWGWLPYRNKKMIDMIAAQLALLALAFSGRFRQIVVCLGLSNAFPVGSAGVPANLHFGNLDFQETNPDDVVGNIECVDSQSPTTFSLDNADDVPFELVHDSGNIATIIRTAELDYDTGPDQYELQITCSDTSGEVSANAIVNVLPENEFLPEYSLQPSVITISEVTAAGTVLASQGSEGLAVITVSDQDRGEDGVLKFEFSSLLTDDAIESTHFEMNETDGTIKLTNTIDVDNDFRSSVTLEVLVCDGDRPQNQCPVNIVDIVIASTNEFAPEFSQPTYMAAKQEYREGEYRDEVIATVDCTDADTGVGELQGIELIETLAPLQLVRRSIGQTEVVLNGSLDSEVIRTQDLQVQLICSDNGNPPKTATATISLHVKDLDDNLPEFTELLYEPGVEETLPVGSQVVAVVCTDKDFGTGDLAEIRLLNASTEVTRTFEIDPKTGNITLNKSLDFDFGLQSYSFSVVCRDTAGNEVTARVNLTVIPVNDEKVQFTRSDYNFSVDRLKIPGEVLGKVETRDGDLDSQQVITYSIEDNSHFRIDSSGQVVLDNFILALQGDEFRLSVTASDGANEEARTMVVVTVDGPLSVLDIVLIISGALVLVFIIGLTCCGYCIRKR